MTNNVKLVLFWWMQNADVDISELEPTIQLQSLFIVYQKQS